MESKVYNQQTLWNAAGKKKESNLKGMPFISSLEAVKPTEPKSKVRSNAMFASCNTNTNTSARVTALGVDERHLEVVVFVACMNESSRRFGSRVIVGSWRLLYTLSKLGGLRLKKRRVGNISIQVDFCV